MGVVQAERMVLARGYGYAELLSKTPIDGQTNFDLASVSKQFCATSVLMLAQDQRLQLEHRLGLYLSGLPAYAGRVKIHHLLSMTSGLPEYDDSQPVSLASLVESLAQEEPSFAPGARFEYLNLNYALLTFVVEKVTGQPMGTVLEQRIFQPLGMKNTVFLSRRGQPIAARATGYRQTPKGWVVSRNDVPGVCDGNIFSNLNDLSRWEIDWLKGSSLLGKKWCKLAWKEARTGSGYAYGFEVDQHRGLRRISHTGAWNGTATYMSLYPQKKLGIIVLSNREDEDVYSLGEQVEDLYLGAPADAEE